MDFDLTEDQKEIKNVARELLSARAPMSKLREAAEAGEYDEALWNEIIELGWPGIAVDERFGGQGLGAVELAVLMEELGYACAATPFLSTAVAAAVIQAAGTDEQRAALVAGARVRRTDWRALAAPSWWPTGSALRSWFCWMAMTRGWSRNPARRRSSRSTRRGGLRAVIGDGESLADGAVAASTWRSRPRSSGVCQRALEMTVEYVKNRKQFGVPVGSFQAVSHRCAQMLLQTESARSTAYFAAWAADADPSRLARQPRSRPLRRPPAGARSRRAQSRLTAGSGSRGRPTSTGCTSARSSTPRCSVARGAITGRWRARRRGG